MAGGIEADTRHAGPASASPAAKQGRTYANSVCVRVRVRQARFNVSRQAEKRAAGAPLHLGSRACFRYGRSQGFGGGGFR
jgi:hypothetical protein